MKLVCQIEQPTVILSNNASAYHMIAGASMETDTSQSRRRHECGMSGTDSTQRSDREQKCMKSRLKDSEDKAEEISFPSM